MVPEQFLEKTTAIRLWVHECERVLSDRLISDTDIALFTDYRFNVTRKFFEDTPQVGSAYHLYFWHAHLFGQ